MGSAAIRTEHDRKMAIKRIESAELPCTMTLTRGAPRSIEQNRLNRMWMLELEQQGDMTAEEYRAYCKLHIGVPILRNAEPGFKEKYDSIVRPLDYHKKIELMMVPFDFPVTRMMTTRQHMEYLDKVHEHFSCKGFSLTQPEHKNG